MKILFFVVLSIIFLISFSVVLFHHNPNTGINAFLPVSFLTLVVYIGHVFLNLEISTKAISIRKRIKVLENSNTELMQLSTSFYKLIILNFGLINRLIDSGGYKDKHKLIRKEVDKYINSNDLLIFLDEMETIKKNLPETQMSKVLKILESHSENFMHIIGKFNKE